MDLRGTGTVISQTQYKIVYLISFILTFFSSTFYNKFEPEPEPQLVGTGTVKNSYGSATLGIWE
jgi:hypothetical protein